MNKRQIAEEVNKIRNVYQKAREALYREERGQLNALQEECGQLGHDWKLHPTAGEGCICDTCGARRMDEDDEPLVLQHYQQDKESSK